MTDISLDIYDRYRKNAFSLINDNGENMAPTLEDEIALAYHTKKRIDNLKKASEASSAEEFKRFAIRNRDDGSYYQYTPENQALFRQNYEINKDYNPRKVVKGLYNKYLEDNPDTSFMDKREIKKRIRKANLYIPTDFEDYEFTPEILNDYGQRIIGDTKEINNRGTKYAWETAEDYAVDLPLKILGNTGETLKFVYDSPKYFLDDRGDQIWDAISYATPGLNAIKAASELAIAGGNWAQYEAHLKENPHLAQSLEFAGELALTLPLEGLAIAKMTSNLGRRSVLNKLDKTINTKSRFFTDSIKKWYAKGRKKTAMAVRTRGMRNVIKEQQRDLMYATGAMAAVEGGFQTLFAYDKLDEQNPWVNAARIPAMILGGVMIPGLVHNGLQNLGMMEGGGHSLVKELKFHAKAAATGDAKDKSIDSYLKDVLGYSENTIVKQRTTADKFRLAQITRKQFQSMQDFGEAIGDLKKYDDLNGTNLADENIEWIETVMDGRDKIFQIRAKAQGYKNVEQYLEENVKDVARLDLFMDQLLVSDGARAIRTTLADGVKIPALQKLNAQTLYNDTIRHSLKEAEQRDMIAETLVQLNKDAVTVGDEASINLIQGLKNLNDKHAGSINDSIRRAELNRNAEIEEIKTRISSNEDLNNVDFTTNKVFQELSEEDQITAMSQRYIMDELGYTPNVDMLNNLDEFKAVAVRDGTQAGTTNIKIEQAAREVFTDKYNETRRPIDKLYNDARSTDLKVGIEDSDAIEFFDNLKNRATDQTSDAANKMTGNFKASNSYENYVGNVKKEFLEKASDEDLLKLHRSNYTDADGNMVSDAEYAKIEINGNVPAAADRKDLINDLVTKDFEFNLSINDLHDIRSKLLRQGRNYRGNFDGKEASDMAEDLRQIIEMTSQKAIKAGDETIASFVDADKKWAQDFVPLFKEGVGGDIANLRNGVPDNKIFSSFIESSTPALSARQFKQIFGTDKRAAEGLKLAMGEHLEKGKKFEPKFIQGLIEEDIIEPGLGKRINEHIIKKNRNLTDLKLKYVAETLNEGVRRLNPSQYDFAGEKFVNMLTGGNVSSAQIVYDAIKATPAITIMKVIDDIAKQTGKSKESIGEMFELISSKGLVDELIVKSDEIVRGRASKTELAEALSLDETLNINRTEEFVGSTQQQVKNLFTKVTEGGTPFRRKQTDEVIDEGFAKAIEAEEALDTGDASKMLDSSEVIVPDNYKPKEKLIDRKVSYLEELDTKKFEELLQGKYGQFLKQVNPKKYQELNEISSFANVVDYTTKGAAKRAEGMVKSLTPESVISRIYSIVRGVVSMRYVVSEAGFQAFRNRRMDLLKQMLADRRTPTIILDMMKADGLKDPVKKARWIRQLRAWFSIPQEVADEDIAAALQEDYDRNNPIKRKSNLIDFSSEKTLKEQLKNNKIFPQ